VKRGSPLSTRGSPPVKRGSLPVKRGSLPVKRGSLPVKRGSPPARFDELDLWVARPRPVRVVEERAHGVGGQPGGGVAPRTAGAKLRFPAREAGGPQLVVRSFNFSRAPPCRRLRRWGVCAGEAPRDRRTRCWSSPSSCGRRWPAWPVGDGLAPRGDRPSTRVTRTHRLVVYTRSTRSRRVVCTPNHDVGACSLHRGASFGLRADAAAIRCPCRSGFPQASSGSPQ
jgi:hypothetical protein